MNPTSLLKNENDLGLSTLISIVIAFSCVQLRGLLNPLLEYGLLAIAILMLSVAFIRYYVCIGRLRRR